MKNFISLVAFVMLSASCVPSTSNLLPETPVSTSCGDTEDPLEFGLGGLNGGDEDYIEAIRLTDENMQKYSLSRGLLPFSINDKLNGREIYVLTLRIHNSDNSAEPIFIYALIKDVLEAEGTRLNWTPLVVTNCTLNRGARKNIFLEFLEKPLGVSLTDKFDTLTRNDNNDLGQFIPGATDERNQLQMRFYNKEQVILEDENRRLFLFINRKSLIAMKPNVDDQRYWRILTIEVTGDKENPFIILPLELSLSSFPK
jgi:hypothetical protein